MPEIGHAPVPSQASQAPFAQGLRGLQPLEQKPTRSLKAEVWMCAFNWKVWERNGRLLCCDVCQLLLHLLPWKNDRHWDQKLNTHQVEQAWREAISSGNSAFMSFSKCANPAPSSGMLQARDWKVAALDALPKSMFWSGEGERHSTNH